MNTTQNVSAPSYDAATAIRLLGFRNSEAAHRMFIPPPTPVPGFITFFDAGLCINLMRLQFGELFSKQTWYDSEAFARTAEPPRYRQLRTTALPDSFDKTFAEQQVLLAADEEIPSTRVVVMGMVIHYLATGERLFLNCWVRCIDQDSDGNRVFVGLFDFGGFLVRYYCDDARFENLGLASARKL